MDFDDEMSGLQIEDLGEYFLQTDIGDSWKGFSLGYVEEEKASAPPSSSSGQAHTASQSHSSSDAGAAGASSSQAMRFGSTSASMATTTVSSAPIAIPNAPTASQQQLLASPPMSSFSELLKHGGAFSLGSPRQDFSFSPAMFATAANMLKTSADSSRMHDDPMDLSNFSLDALKKLPVPAQQQQPPSQATTQPNTLKALAPAPSSTAATKPSPAKSTTPVCQNILDTQDERSVSETAKAIIAAAAAVTASEEAAAVALSASAKRPFDEVEPCSMDSCSTIAQPEDDRGYRKKSREKMRRQEVNVKFDELIELLGLSNRVRKSAILQEAVAAIKALKRDRDEMRRERDRLQQEVSKLATCLQYSHLGSVANAMSMAQAPGTQPQQLEHMNMGLSAQQLAQLNSSSAANLLAGVPHGLQVPGGFALGAGAFGALPSAATTPSSTATGLTGAAASAPSASTSTKVAIAPKTLKPVAPAVSPFAGPHRPMQ